jgi:hypothetical protein
LRFSERFLNQLKIRFSSYSGYTRAWSMPMNLTRVVLLVAGLSTSLVAGPPAHRAVSDLALPLAFESNHGQMGSRPGFVVNTGDWRILLSRNGMEASAPVPGRPDVTVRLAWLGAAAGDPEGRTLLPGKANYLLGPPEKWITDVPMYGRVLYRQLYPAVDAIFYAREGRLEHDFVLAPGADLSRLRFRLRGGRATLAADGDISVQANGSVMTLHKPVAYQETGGVRQYVKATYVRRAADIFAFEVGTYDRRRELVIDPVVTFSTFVSPGTGGGTEASSASVLGLAGDAAGNSYVLINNGSLSGNLTKIYKINASGSAVVFQTTIPPAQVMAVDPAGNSYFAGTIDPSFTPTPGAFQTSNVGKRATIFKLNAAGNQITNATYLGGSTSEVPFGISADAAGNAYVSGITYSNDFPLMHAFQTSFGGGAYDVFVTELKPDLSGLLVSTYLGGNSGETPIGVASDGSGNIYVAGTTMSSNFPVANAIIATAPSTNSPFVTKIASDGTLAYSTYFGGTQGSDVIHAIAAMNDGSLFLAGEAISSDFPLLHSLQAFQNAPNHTYPFISKLTSAGQIAYSTLLPEQPSTNGAASGIAVDTSGQAYAVGLYSDFPNPVSDLPPVNAVQSVPNLLPSGCSPVDNAFVVVLDSTPSFVFASYLAGSESLNKAVGQIDLMPRVVLAGNNGLRVAAEAPPWFPLVNPVQPVFNGACSPASLRFAYHPVLAAIDLSTSAPALGIGPIQLAFLAQPLGTTSASQTINLQNLGSAPLTITNVATSGDFAETDTCNGSIAAGSACSASVTFTPTAAGTRNGTVTFTDNAGGSPQVVQLTGNGAASAVTLSASSLDFGSQPANTTSAPQSVTLTNSGSATLNIGRVDISGDFAESNNCGTSVAMGASCTLSVTFRPTANGSRTGQLTITDNSADSPQTVALKGIGGAAPAVTLSPSSLDFGSQPANTTSAPQSVTLTNSGSATLNISRVDISGDFAQTNNCGTSVAMGASCTLSVTFHPTANGSRTGQLTITDDSAGSPQTVALKGSGMDFVVAAPSTTTATVNAGQTATYNLSVMAAAGFSGAVNLTCSGAPATAMCSVPSSVNATGGGTTPFTVTVTTTPRTSAYLKPRWRSIPWLAFALLMAGLPLARRKSTTRTLVILFALGFSSMLVSCGGGSSSSPPKVGTAAGTYTVTVTGTAGSTTSSMNLTLNVM